MSLPGKYLMTAGIMTAMVWGMTSAATAGGVPHNAAFKALGQQDHSYRSYRSYDYNYSAAPVEQRSFSAAPEATDVPPAPAAHAEHAHGDCSSAAVPAPAPAAVAQQQQRRSYSYEPQPQPSYQYRSYGYRGNNVPNYALPRALRH